MYSSTSASNVDWSTSNVRTRLSDVILPLVPYNVRTRIQTVKKYSSIYENGQILKNGLVTNDMLWIPSAQEILGGSSYETEGTINMQIVAMDADELASGGTAPLTFLGMELLLQTSGMNTTNTNANGYPATNVMKPLLDNTIYPLLPSNIKERVQRVNKTYYDYTTSSTLSSIEKLWIPSAREMVGDTSYESSGVMYTTIFKNATSRIKKRNGSENGYWLRSAHSGNSFRFCFMGIYGSVGFGNASVAYGVALGFCLGLEPETIQDSWSTILANTNPSATQYR